MLINLPQQAFLNSLLTYHDITGEITWNSNGLLAGSHRKDKGIQIKIKNIYYMAHRIIWVLAYGKAPEEGKVIDHINGNRSDNRLCNLRCVTQQENLQNQHKAHKGNASGFLGVTWDAPHKAYKARIHVKGKDIFLGLYKTPKEAHNAYLVAKQMHHQGNTLIS